MTAAISEITGTAEKVRRRKEIGQMAQWLRTLFARSENPGSVPGTHMVAHNLP